MTFQSEKKNIFNSHPCSLGGALDVLFQGFAMGCLQTPTFLNSFRFPVRDRS